MTNDPRIPLSLQERERVEGELRGAQESLAELERERRQEKQTATERESEVYTATTHTLSSVNKHTVIELRICEYYVHVYIELSPTLCIFQKTNNYVVEDVSFCLPMFSWWG